MLPHKFGKYALFMVKKFLIDTSNINIKDGYIESSWQPTEWHDQGLETEWLVKRSRSNDEPTAIFNGN